MMKPVDERTRDVIGSEASIDAPMRLDTPWIVLSALLVAVSIDFSAAAQEDDAQPVWNTSRGEVRFEFEVDEYAVWSFVPADGAGEGRIIIEGLGSSGPGSGRFQGYWVIRDGSEQPCSSSRYDIEGFEVFNHGGFEITFDNTETLSSWSAGWGLCDEPANQSWTGTLVGSESDASASAETPEARTEQQEEAEILPPEPLQPAETPAPPMSAANPSEEEAGKVWSIIKDTQVESDLEIFVNSFPGTFYAQLAEARLRSLREQTRTSTTVPERRSQPEPAPVPPAEPEADKLTITPRIIPVGKWPEGIGYDGSNLWVAESGQRRIAQIDASNGQILRRVKVGRLPVGIHSDRSGNVFVLVATDRKIWQQRRGRKGRVFGHVGEYPIAIAGNDQAVYVLGWVDNSNAQFLVYRFRFSDGSRTQSAHLGPGGEDVAATADSVFTVQTPPGRNTSQLTRLDSSNLQVRGREMINVVVRHLAATDLALFAAGYTYQGNGTIVKFDANTGQEVTRIALDSGPVFDLVTSGDLVLAIGQYGTISILDTDSLRLKRQIRLDFDFGQSYPHSLTVFNQSLAVSTHTGRGENGSVLLVENWRP